MISGETVSRKDFYLQLATKKQADKAERLRRKLIRESFKLKTDL